MTWAETRSLYPGEMWRRPNTRNVSRRNKLEGKLNLSQNVPEVSLDMLKAPSHVQGGPSACRERFCEFTFKTCFMSQLAVRATYCQSKALYSWSIFRKISPYKQLGRTEGKAARLFHGTLRTISITCLSGHNRMTFTIIF